MEPTPSEQPTAVVAVVVALVAVAIAILNAIVAMVMLDQGSKAVLLWFTFFAIVQLVVGVVAIVKGVKASHREQRGGIAAVVIGALVSLGGMIAAAVGMLTLLISNMNLSGLAGGAWGRPLRIRGRQLHPELREGSDWTRGDQPDARELDAATRAALEALWLHDAQKEHASVPAFSRISWMLAAVGAPAELIEWSHRAALEEIEHTRRCFALAAGYGGRSHSVEPMPDLLLGFDGGEDPLVTLAVESLGDGCQLEDFNADVAAACAEVCREPATREVLELIAVEERSHAEFSWALLDWVLERDFDRVAPAIEAALAKLREYPRPTAVSRDKLRLVARADADALLAHGRLPDARWAQLWDLRLAETNERVRARLDARTRCNDYFQKSRGQEPKGRSPGWGPLDGRVPDRGRGCETPPSKPEATGV